MSELFPPETVASKSPMRLWMEKHRLVVQTSDEFGSVCQSSDPDLEDDTGDGTCEADAIFDWAKRNGVRLWNEENL